MSWIRLFFSPYITWACRPLSSPKTSVQHIAQPSRRSLRRFWGLIHSKLRVFSFYYCRWYEIPSDNQIIQLPFGLILKWSDGTRIEEVLAMQVARSAGFPIPLVLCYGEHPDSPHAPISILMTRLPGKELGQVYETLSDVEKNQIFEELDVYLNVMRQWRNPYGDHRICSVSGTTIRSVRVPGHTAGPFESEQDFHDYLLGAAWSGGFKSEKEFTDALTRAQQIKTIHHDIVFTHGDLKHHNILVHNGHISGFLDWESAGWYPEYWELTTAMRFTRRNFWWYDFVLRLGGGRYLAELDCESALNSLTNSSYYW